VKTETSPEREHISSCSRSGLNMETQQDKDTQRNEVVGFDKTGTHESNYVKVLDVVR